jgi:hypothetical protein
MWYDPGHNVTGHPLNLYNTTELHGQCSNFANLLRGLLRSVGIPADTAYLWGGDTGDSEATFYTQASTGRLASFRLVRGAHPQQALNNVGANPHFTFHAVVSGVPGAATIFDPSYGDTPAGVQIDEAFDHTTSTFIEGAPANGLLVQRNAPLWAWAIRDLSPFVACIH